MLIFCAQILYAHHAVFLKKRKRGLVKVDVIYGSEHSFCKVCIFLGSSKWYCPRLNGSYLGQCDMARPAQKTTSLMTAETFVGLGQTSVTDKGCSMDPHKVEI